MTTGPTHTLDNSGAFPRVIPQQPILLSTHDPSRDPVQWPAYREDSLLDQAAREAARTLNVPYSMAMMCAFGAMATACQRQVDVLMPGSQSPTITSLMLLTIADSGSGKSRTERYFFEALREHEQRLQSEDEGAQQAYATALKSWKIKEKALTRLYEKAIRNMDASAEAAAQEALQAHQDSQPDAPPRRRLLYDDSTAPGLLQTLHANTPYACLLTSEAASFFNGQAVQAFDKFNTLWSGDPVTVDRATRSSFRLPKTRLTLALMAQPRVIERFLKKHGEQARGTGFMARLLVACPEKRPPGSTPTASAALPHREAFQARLRHLLEHDVPAQPQVLRFTEQAVAFWEKCADYLLQQDQPFKLYADHKDHAARLLENTARLAAVLHTFERKTEDDVEISIETLRFCWDFVRACSQHFLQHLAEEPQLISDTHKLVDHLLRLPKESPADTKSSKGSQEQFTVSDLQRYGPNCLRKPEDQERLHAALNLLMELGHVRGYPYRSHEGYYRFSYQCLTRDPCLRNGVDVTIKTLPLYGIPQAMRR